MKKIKLILSMAVVALTLTLTSCSKSTDSLIEEYGQTLNEYVEAHVNGDTSKAEKLESKIDDLSKELDSRELTDEQHAKIVQYTFAAGLQAAMHGGFDE